MNFKTLLLAHFTSLKLLLVQVLILPWKIYTQTINPERYTQISSLSFSIHSGKNPKIWKNQNHVSVCFMVEISSGEVVINLLSIESLLILNNN